MPASQRNDEFAEPPRHAIPGISRDHVAGMEASADDAVWQGAGMHHLVLRTLGRRSGTEHKVALPYWVEPAGPRIVVASFAGSPAHPAWYLNLTDAASNPEVLVREQHRRYWAAPEVLAGEERARIWAWLTADRSYYGDYQTRTDRQIPVVRLLERRPA